MQHVLQKTPEGELRSPEKSLTDKILNKIENLTNPPTSTPQTVQCQQFKPHPTLKMYAAEWRGTKSIVLENRAAPTITEPADAVVRITSTLICGSDLHFYNNQVPGVYVMHSGDIVGHEGMGIVTEVGENCHSFKPGDRVVISAPIACGQCEYCQKQQFSLCDTTNPSGQQEWLYGHRLCGVFGYGHVTGGYAGCQAEYVRVPWADMNLLKVPPTLTDDQVVMLSDVICTAWHGNQLGEVSSNDVVVIFGCGPIGLMAGYLAKKILKAKRVINIDNIPYRLAIAQKNGCETINFDEYDVIKRVQELVPGGPDVVIDCAGFRFPKSLGQKIMYKLGMESDAVDCVKEAIIICKKGGRIALIGDYFGNTNQFPIGQLMEKAITIRGGQLYAQKYWKDLLAMIESGELDATWLISHFMNFENIAEAYKIFDEKQEDCSKVCLKTKFGREMEQELRVGRRGGGVGVGVGGGLGGGIGVSGGGGGVGVGVGGTGTRVGSGAI